MVQALKQSTLLRFTCPQQLQTQWRPLAGNTSSMKRLNAPEYIRHQIPPEEDERLLLVRLLSSSLLQSVEPPHFASGRRPVAHKRVFPLEVLHCQHHLLRRSLQ
ncbi:hypothetical protein K443DRAFT_649632 [Laccaria amethystina LaAM-08-1]|uniref:Uncharacterized protein n=1 Tax=Laccaria amethystina LaAM-08-1 TaxID=1095629 RepID=A0A0C9XR30_9AGAR|nr:hypothetical protein K443DRAFT_649632 [Laccaria amethystina LaAM-08-1]